MLKTLRTLLGVGIPKPVVDAHMNIFDDLNRLENLPIYADNAAAVADGLAEGDFYRTGDDPDLVCVVH